MIIINTTRVSLMCTPVFFNKIQKVLTNISINIQIMKNKINFKIYKLGSQAKVFFPPTSHHCFQAGSASLAGYYLSRTCSSPPTLHSLWFSLFLSHSFCLSFNFSFLLHWDTRHVHCIPRIITMPMKHWLSHFNPLTLNKIIIKVKLVATSL